PDFRRRRRLECLAARARELRRTRAVISLGGRPAGLPGARQTLQHGIAIVIGAALGALLRWRLGYTLNQIFPTIPLGTLAANLVGGLLAGVCLEYFARNAAVPPEFR